jgi:hypothetical protein
VVARPRYFEESADERRRAPDLVGLDGLLDAGSHLVRTVLDSALNSRHARSASARPRTEG